MSVQSMSIKKKASEILLDIDAVNISTAEPFQYASGLLSPIYTKCRVLLSYPKERKEIIKLMIKQITSLKNKIDTIASAGTSSTFIASLLAQYLGIPMVFIRPSRKKHGKKKEIEGDFKSGSNVLLVSDIFSTEEDIPNSVRVIQRNRGTIKYCLAVFDNNLGKINSFLNKNGIPFSTLTDLTTLLNLAHEKGRITTEEKKIVEDWMKDPEKWNRFRIGRVNIKDHINDIKKWKKTFSDKMEVLLEENQRKMMKFGNISKLLEANKIEIAKILIDIKAVTVNSKEPYRYTSGILSPIYADNRLLISHPKKWNYIVDSFVDSIINCIGLQNFDILSGIAMSGIPHATLISEKLGLPLVYVKTEPNGEDYIEGRLTENTRAIIIEDHITTGSSALESVNKLRKCGVIVEWCVAIFTYGFKKAINAFNEAKVKLLTLCDVTTLLNVALQMKYIGLNDRNAVEEWLKDPQSWGLRRHQSLK